jgi:hypothetical protein
MVRFKYLKDKGLAQFQDDVTGFGMKNEAESCYPAKQKNFDADPLLLKKLEKYAEWLNIEGFHIKKVKDLTTYLQQYMESDLYPESED